MVKSFEINTIGDKEMVLDPIRVQSATQIFEQKIEAMILSGQLKIGDRLPTEAELAEALEITKNIVHKGLTNLAARGFLRIIPRHGVYVADYVENGTSETLLAFMRIYDNNGKMDNKLIISTVRVRVIIESAVLRELAAAHSDARLTRPLGLLAEMREKLDSANPPDSKWFGNKFAEEFHALCMASDNISIPIMMNPFTSSCAEFSRIWVEQIGAQNAVAAREKLYDYVKYGDGEAAVKFLERYCEEFYGNL